MDNWLECIEGMRFNPRAGDLIKTRFALPSSAQTYKVGDEYLTQLADSKWYECKIVRLIHNRINPTIEVELIADGTTRIVCRQHIKKVRRMGEWSALAGRFYYESFQIQP